MNLGFYIGDQQPAVGGGYSLTETIKKELLDYHGNHNLFIFHSAKSRKDKWTENKVTYVSLWQGRIKCCFYNEYSRKIFRRIGVEFNFTNKILKELDIDLMIFLAPGKMEVEVPFIFAVWDLGHRMLPYFPETSYRGEFEARENLYQYMLPRATYVLTGNETGKREILANYAINAEKIKVVPFPVPSFCSQMIDTPAKLDFVKEPFVFYPAQLWAHKNHIAIVKAIAYLRDNAGIKINCYFAGSEKNNLAKIEACVKQNRLDDQVKFLGFVDYATLLYLYKNALAMVYVSLLGPNNLPPLEACALGCPSIISSLPGHIEQMEGNGLFVDPLNSQEIAETILKLYNEPDFRKDRISKDLKFVEKFKEYSYVGEILRIVGQFEILNNRIRGSS